VWIGMKREGDYASSIASSSPIKNGLCFRMAFLLECKKIIVLYDKSKKVVISIDLDLGIRV
jgi:hypothetical protein